MMRYGGHAYQPRPRRPAVFFIMLAGHFAGHLRSRKAPHARSDHGFRANGCQLASNECVRGSALAMMLRMTAVGRAILAAVWPIRFYSRGSPWPRIAAVGKGLLPRRAAYGRRHELTLTARSGPARWSSSLVETGHSVNVCCNSRDSASHLKWQNCRALACRTALRNISTQRRGHGVLSRW